MLALDQMIAEYGTAAELAATIAHDLPLDTRITGMDLITLRSYDNLPPGVDGILSQVQFHLLTAQRLMQFAADAVASREAEN
jgi:hypothetical protein